MQSRQEIKLQAKESFYPNYWITVGAVFITYGLISAASGVTFFIGGLGSLFIFPPLIVGLNHFCLTLYRGQTPALEDIFSLGFSNYLRNLGGVLWMELFIFLWSLLFVIPGIIKSLAYFATPYLLAEYDNLPATEALKVSMRMTAGHKGEIFVMTLSFFGWFILSGITMGIVGVFYSMPYYSISMAGLYEELKDQAIRSGAISESELY
ncbi:MAG: hypothetical protein PWR12_1206 [Eubacteriaceae bacterium]|jgi:uncharacterized membrane protein|nr:hypothetical protein [Eubacteriaceae bacterium]MDK2905130.1 hypothetical protein [Eubacteriaceae bacterium]MDK2936266.1 hypothetical protein [Eubacteriaceae bacterium]